MYLNDILFNFTNQFKSFHVYRSITIATTFFDSLAASSRDYFSDLYLKTSFRLCYKLHPVSNYMLYNRRKLKKKSLNIKR
jgi:hypothetical protein